MLDLTQASGFTPQTMPLVNFPPQVKFIQKLNKRLKRPIQSKYTFTQKYNWFQRSELRRKVSRFINSNSVNHILEIGSFEGASTVYFADTFLSNDLSFLVSVDPFLGIMGNDHESLLSSGQEEIFLKNIASSHNASKIMHKKLTSDDFFAGNRFRFNFIYIDGCHEPLQVRRDLENSFNCISSGGIIWLDDYMGGGDDQPIKCAIDSCLEESNTKLKVIHKGYQLGLRVL